jgi:alginate biosynthesis protein AlgX
MWIQAQTSFLTGLACATLLLGNPAFAATEACPPRIYLDSGRVALARGTADAYFEVPKDLTDVYDLNGETLAFVAQLGKLLAAHGSQLIALPVPPKGLTLHGSLDPEDPNQRSFSRKSALASYRRVAAQLRAAGIAVADLGAVLDKPVLAESFYFKRDRIWRPEGARYAAEQVARLILADPLGSALPRQVHRTAQIAMVEHRSSTSDQLQRACQQVLKPETAPLFRTTADPVAADDTGTPSNRRPTVVVAGSHLSASPLANFAGFLSEMTGLSVNNASGADDSVYDTLLALVTSPGFASMAPRYLVWEFPLDTSPNMQSLLAMRQILPALKIPCSETNVLWQAGRPAGLNAGSFKLPGGIRYAAPDTALVVGTGDAQVRTVTLRLRYANGASETVALGAPGVPQARSRFVTSLSPDPNEILSEVEVLGAAVGSALELRLCSLRANQGDNT